MMGALLWVLGLSLGISFLCSVLEAVFLSISYSYVAILREQGSRAGRLLHGMQQRIDEPISAILTLNTIAHTVGAAMGGGLALQQFGEEWVAVFSAALTVVILLFSEIVPKTLGAAYWRSLGVPTAYVLHGLIVLMKPLIVPLSVFSRFLARGATESSTISRAELEVLAETGRREGTLGEREWRMVKNVLGLKEITVGDVMTPRTDVVAIPLTASFDEAKRLVLAVGHRRLPVFDRNLDTIVGVLFARDLWRSERRGATVRDILRPVPYAPATKPVDQLIDDLRGRGGKMVIVLDEFGGTAGIATLEDLIEEIVGKIQDEYEDEPLPFQDLGHGITRIWGGVSMREIKQRLGMDLPDHQFDTVGGFVFGALNRIPRAGDEIEIGDGTLTVAEMTGRRIEFVDFRRDSKANPGSVERDSHSS